MKIQKHFGLDVHKEKTTVAIAEGDRHGEVRHYGEISSDLVTTKRALRKIKREKGILHVVYEAGPSGFVLHRHLTRLGIECTVDTTLTNVGNVVGSRESNREATENIVFVIG